MKRERKEEDEKFLLTEPFQETRPPKYLFLVKWWEPFPRSEYGGLVAVIAHNETECVELLNAQYNQSDSLYKPGDPTEAVRAADRWELACRGVESRIVESLIT